MHNPIRRVKRFKQPTRPQLPAELPETKTSDTRLKVPGGDSLTSSSIYVRHRQAAQLDAVRGAVLVALIVVTILLYFVLWELEQSSFASMQKTNLDQNGTVGSPQSGNFEATSKPYSPATSVHDAPALPPGEEFKLTLSDDPTAVPPNYNSKP